ncbi:MAG: SpoVR family protein [Pseudobdellovibrionaceae bacterium]|nr:SpoVR family protein [Bdellovibrionales bacterium]USN48683.1 MAG: SpoVR family protein [Pseudobdellovibrionaceae bacterium]
MKISMVGMLFVVSLWGSLGLAHSDDLDSDLGKETCEEVLLNSGPVKFVASGLSNEEMAPLKQSAHEVIQTLLPVGYSFPPHRMIFTDNSDLNHLMASFGHVVPWWMPGFQIDRSTRAGNSTLEFVESNGCSHCTSIYRGETPHGEQKSIMYHVAGHIDFFENSVWFRDRAVDRWGSGKKIAELVDELITNHDESEVIEFLQRMTSMSELVDKVYGSWDAPAKFMRNDVRLDEMLSLKQIRSRSGHDIVTQGRFPSKPTASGLSFFSANLPEGSPEWQKKLASYFEEYNRMGAGFFQSQYMNEGWATFSQFLGPLLKDKITTDEALSLATLTWWTHHIRLADPKTRKNEFQFANVYYMGRQAWMRKFEKFQERPENQGLSLKEMAKKFVKEAHHDMQYHNDESFLLENLDHEWVSKNKLVLGRAATEDEIPKDAERDASYIKVLATERNYQRIVKKIVREHAHRSLQFPRVLTMDSSLNGDSFHYRHHVYGDIPLNPALTPMWIFEAARAHRKPVTFDTVVPREWYDQVFQQLDQNGVEDPNNPGTFLSVTEGMYPVMPVRLRVTPNGNVRAEVMVRASNKDYKQIMELKQSGQISAAQAQDALFRIVYFKEDPSWFTQWSPGVDSRADFPEAEFIEDTLMTNTMRNYVQYYIEDQLLTDSDPIGDSQLVAQKDVTLSSLPSTRTSFEEGGDLAAELANSGMGHLGVSFGVATGGSRALLKFYTLVRKRQARVLELALSGKRPIHRQQGGVAFQIVPIVPRLAFDDSVRRRRTMSLGPAPVSGAFNYDLPAETDDGTQIFQGDVVEGQVVKGPKNDGSGQGEGEEGDDSSDPGDDPSSNPGQGPHSGGNQETFIPQEVWRNIITANLELPVIRRTGEGENELLTEFWSHSKQMFNEPLDTEQTIETYFENGMAQFMAENPDYFDQDLGPDDVQKFVSEVLRMGVETTDPDDHWSIVKDEEMEPAFKVMIHFVMDRSGSMGGKPLALAKEFVDTTKHLLRRRGVIFESRYIHYDTEAEVVEEEDFFNAGMGGGTADASGMKLANEEVARVPTDEFIQYVFILGDGDSTDEQEASHELRKLERQADYVGVVNIDVYNRGAERGNLPAYKRILGPSETGDLVIIDEGVPSFYKALRQIFRQRIGPDDED